MGRGMGNGVYLLKLMVVESESHSPSMLTEEGVIRRKWWGEDNGGGDWETADNQASRMPTR